ncbi:hypothetical protein GCM10027429_22330 [Marivirga atlantica]|jgi:hypothetical protein|uniref:DUF998 domain-containing protein n=1 Tax=Marivirga atlantica TaxID=1548457 RepID=A0A937ABG1_9BACT|nr:DUF998 domain-containing protein [Marivirga atlantica]MBL0765851.1 DUF998 domain-containing protein [Marivirga atlantica]
MSTQNSSPNIWLSSTKNFRRVVGLNGMLLPLLLWLFLYLTSGHVEVLKSISHYYYTRSNSIFIGVMATLSMFLIVYNYKDKKADFIASCIAGVAAICVILFPTDNLLANPCLLEDSFAISYTPPNTVSEKFHLLAAAVFFMALAYMSFFLFVKSNKPKGERSKNKIIRNTIYRVCAVLMVLSIAVIGLLSYTDIISEARYDALKITFWMEVLAIESFGFSWLIKGEFFFED